MRIDEKNAYRRRDDKECEQIHGVNTRHTVFEVLLEPVFGQLEIIVIPEGDKKTRKHKKDSYPDMKFVKKAPDEMRELGIKNIWKMGYKNQVSRQGTHAC